MGAILLLALSLALTVYGLLLRLPRFSPRRSMLHRLDPDRVTAPDLDTPLARRLRLVPATRDVSPRRFRQVQWGLAATAALVQMAPWLVLQAEPDWAGLAIYPPLCWALPELWLRVQLRRRRFQLTRAYPDLLTHLATQTRSGATTLQALASSPPVLREPLKGEVEALVADLVLLPFDEALQRFAGRCATAQIAGFAAHLSQQMALGAALAEVLEAEEAHLLATSRQGARQRIQRSAVVLAAVTVILLLNGLLIYFTPVLFDLTRFLAG
jgi:Flp pilus assembly protein TadB